MNGGMNMNKKKGIAILMAFALSLPSISSAIPVKAEEPTTDQVEQPSYEIQYRNTEGWNVSSEETETSGAYTFHMFRSVDGNSAWIYKIDIDADKGDTKTLTIPEKISGLPVTTIGSPEFEDGDYCKNVFGMNVEDYHGCDGYTNGLKETTKLMLPSTLTAIKPYAFNGMRALKKVKIPDGVSVLENSIFSWCENLAEVTLPSGLAKFYTHFYRVWSTGNSFSRCFKLKKVKLSSKCKNFKVKNNLLLSKDGKTLVWASQGITNVKIPSTVQNIEAGAFGGTRATKISLGTHIKSIGNDAFTSKKIKKVTLSKKNKNFVQKGDVVYSKKDKSLVIAITNKSKIVIPKPVKKIMGDVSLCGSSVKKIYLPSSLQTIGKAWQFWNGIASPALYFKGTKPPKIVSDVPEWEYSCIPWYEIVYVKKSCKKKYIAWAKSRDSEFERLRTY